MGASAEAVNPTKKLAFLSSGTPEAEAARLRSGLPDADDLLGAYSYLASDAARWTTGSAIVVDGGWMAR